MSGAKAGAAVNRHVAKALRSVVRQEFEKISL